ncbi:UDP-N-acetylmuramoylalanyl-D-glutamyl-2,6-diamin opimelate/D-alanyl-D-alanyl ligase [Pseudopedobacter saltans DSM 12145]|uniref:UDP-N-acetylmuramoyl-tripeptide--D-alanyl-D-alanine ligase n=1 Tax=Pseudopedobacter saltans (strain ATCC 51119 / DSM 12145 / JCM 21818 / CCUG 39354 / LMG 10337 / NBRC 100064 / NCIMB 13643) TaxID=762903 RepID=F0S8C5_PSESL|nr:UDP-N-acetylmuramoyl-tripeptide--D-alanyl-D-alanine ligase [Pseudopedobacter saltans]ADY53389.1 UDP-N-acetylmuramoylalanyl-D-glutamyl-2,6-diamin opimelate/D-alanyl-D-alanyl ligase [Pseudopedobacter saltans DSM 12145]
MRIEELYPIFRKHPSVSTDTRKVTESCLFFALKGENFDANTFAEQAIALGAAFAIVDKQDLPKHPQFIFVDDVLKTLQDLAHYHRRQLGLPVIGLTGTNGKTTTKELINAVLSQKFKTAATLGNLNNHIGVPLTLLAITPDTEVAIVEMGANHQKEIELLCAIAVPDYGLITNVGKAHLEGFGGFEGVKKGKGELYDFLSKNGGTVFINRDNLHLQEMARSRSFKEVIYYGTSSDNYVFGKLIANDPYLTVEWSDGENKDEVQSQLTGIYNFENILAAIAIGKKLGLTTQQIHEGINSYKPQNNRSQIIKTERNTVIGDFYNANPSSMAVAIENIARLEADNKVLILGDMFELGEESGAEHRAVIEKAEKLGIAKVLFVGQEFFKNSNQKSVFLKNVEELRTYLHENPVHQALILLKGSRGMKLEQVIAYL